MVDLNSEGRVTYVDLDGQYNESLTMDLESDLFKDIRKDLESGANILISVTSALNKS